MRDGTKQGRVRGRDSGSKRPTLRVRRHLATVCAPLAQLVEHLTLNQGVQGSSP